MTVLFFDSFDFGANRQTGGLDANYGDYGGWYGGTLGGYRQFVTGYTSGQAIECRRGDGHTGYLAHNYGALPSQVRLGCWLKGTNHSDGVPTAGHHQSIFGLANNGVDKSLGIMATMTGTGAECTFSLIRYDSVDTDFSATVEVLAASGTAYDLEAAWIYFELIIDLVAGTISVTKDDTTNFLTYTGDLSNVIGTFSIFLSSADTAKLAFDHVWMTDGTAPAGTSTMAVSVGAVISQNGGFNNVKGFISLGTAVNYYGSPTNSGGTGGSTPDGRYWKETYWIFGDNPSDSSAWTAAAIASIDTWGLCYCGTGVGNELYVTSMGLNYLQSNNGKPIVSITTPSSQTGFSGAWTKIDSSQTYVAHVKNIPAQNSSTITGYLYLETSTIGCLQFYTALPAPTFDYLGLSFAEEKDPNHVDWATVEAEDFVSYLISGYKLHGQGDKRFQSNYVTVSYTPGTDYSAYFQGIWEYASTPSTGRWGTKQQVFRVFDRYDHALTRLKVRGQGRALSFRVLSESGKQFEIDGWVVDVTSNAKV